MAFDPGAISSNLAAAVGDEPTLIAELKLAFGESAERVLAAMQAAEDRDSWNAAASRLKSLTASFGATSLMGLAEQALSLGRPDPVVLRKIRSAIRRL